ncbi:hypothetical protein GRQ65_01945 [Nocardioides sp. YIM 123512]|uniref:Uncharacterized protein n=1 Tax=Nocardioides flavescens TaxID=2691959 RepID=A0A6L7ENW6_9ACTN|nr:hypothetical protein [Nocardioides flavescens]
MVQRDGDRDELARSDRFGAAKAKRARIVLLAADGVASARIADCTDATFTTVLNGRGRYERHGIAGLPNALMFGGPRELEHRAITG